MERQQEEEKVLLGDKVLHLLLDIDAASRRHELLTSQLETLNQQREVTRIAYKFGRGSTSQILGMEDKRDRLTEKIVEVEIERDEAVRELIQLTGHEVEEAQLGKYKENLQSIVHLLLHNYTIIYTSQ